MLVARAGAAVGGPVGEAVPGEGPRASKHPILSPRGSLLAHACGISYSQKDSPAPPHPGGWEHSLPRSAFPLGPGVPVGRGRPSSGPHCTPRGLASPQDGAQTSWVPLISCLVPQPLQVL